jgi:hypothetical protein
MAPEFELPSDKALLVIDTEPINTRPIRPLKLLTGLIGLARHFLSRLRP